MKRQQSIEEITRENWIQELRSYGVRSAPDGTPLQNMSYLDLRNQLAKEQILRGE